MKPYVRDSREVIEQQRLDMALGRVEARLRGSCTWFAAERCFVSQDGRVNSMDSWFEGLLVTNLIGE